MRTWTAAMTVAMLAAGLAGGCRHSSKSTVSLHGSTSIQPFAEILGQEFEKKNPGVRVDPQGGGSTAGITALANGIADIGTCSRALSEKEAKSYRPITIAIDGLAVVVHPSNPVKGLTLEQARRIFTGEIGNWKEVGGADHAIALNVREAGSGTQEAFAHLVMKTAAVNNRAAVYSSNGEVKGMIKNDPNAIGYMSLGLVGDGSAVRAVAIDGVEATLKNVADGSYALWRPFLFVVKGTPRLEVQKFIDYVLSDEGQALLEKDGLVRAPKK